MKVKISAQENGRDHNRDRNQEIIGYRGIPKAFVPIAKHVKATYRRK